MADKGFPPPRGHRPTATAACWPCRTRRCPSPVPPGPDPAVGPRRRMDGSAPIQPGRPDGRGPAGGNNRTSPRDGRRRQRTRPDADAGLVVCYHRRKFPRQNDRAMPDTLQTLAPAIKCAVLYVRGDQEDPEETYPARRPSATEPAGPVDVAIIPNCDHFYRGQETPANRVHVNNMAALHRRYLSKSKRPFAAGSRRARRALSSRFSACAGWLARRTHPAPPPQRNLTTTLGSKTPAVPE